MPDHFALPFRLVGGRAAVIEQDTDAEIRQCARVALMCPQGARLELPSFGLPDQTFRVGGPDLASIERTLDTWEPRARAQASGDDGRLDEWVAQVLVGISQAAA